MTKIALITDTHAGVRGDSISFLDNIKKFYDGIFFPYIDEHGIDTVVHLGDLVDRRKYVNFNTANRLRVDFLEPIFSRGIDFHLAVGNHDCSYKNTNELNALHELVAGKYERASIYVDATEVTLHGLPVLFVPWICSANRAASMEAIRTSSSKVCFGHLEIDGFVMYRNSQASNGLDRKLFDRFELVCTGHYHHKSSDGTVHYLGAPAEFTWSDYDDRRGFHVFDTETLELEFVQNSYTMHTKTWYDDSTKTHAEVMTGTDFDSFANKIVRVIVTAKTNPYCFDSFISEIEKKNPVALQVVDDHYNADTQSESEIVGEVESTVDSFMKYVDTMDTSVDREKLKDLMKALYVEASESR